ncbi:MAG TPA: lysophospholipid acyltransferase family protein [Candidatus Acidoferrales bacterium]|nr:lysophospholipid acyltransferase family protein [Candidatus Acidoferrales bacterium]
MAAVIALELGRLIVRVVPQRLCFLLARLAADLGFFVVYRFRQRSLHNLAIAFGRELDGATRKSIARRSLRGFFQGFVEMGLALTQPLEKMRQDIPLAGKEHLERALARGRGVIVLSAHLGNFFLLGSRLAAEGYPVWVVVKPTFGDRCRRFADLMDSYRLKLGQRTIRARPRRRAVRELIEALRRNEIVVIIADEYRSKGLPVTFFGRTVLARRGASTLALRAGGGVVPVVMARDGNGKLRARVEPELEFVQTGRLSDDVRENTRRMTNWVETLVRAYPDQWNWAVVRWQERAGDRPGAGGSKGSVASTREANDARKAEGETVEQNEGDRRA